MKYPATFKPDTGGFVVTFRDIPEAITQGDDEADAVDMAKDALLLSIDFYFEQKRHVPLPPNQCLANDLSRFLQAWP